MKRHSAIVLFVLCASCVGAASAADAPYAEPKLLGNVENELIRESSGLAISRRDSGILWTHNDSGDGAVVYAMDMAGKSIGAVMLDDVWARDWEDMASVVLDGKPTLVLGDIGDNVRKRRRLNIYFIEEPTAEEAKLVISDGTQTFRKVAASTLHVKYADEPHDCESLTVDPTTRKLYLITKQYGADKRPTMVYGLDLPENIEGQTLELTKVAELPLKAATAADMSADGRRLVVISRGAAHVYERSADEDWAEALKRSPLRVRLPRLKQGESVAFGEDGWTLYLTSEKRPTPLWQIPLSRSEPATD